MKDNTEADVWGRIEAELRLFKRPFPRQAVALANAHRDTVAPRLLQVLHDVVDRPADADDDDYVFHHFAMVLLASWRDTRAWQPLLAWARMPGQTLEDLLGDVLHETYDRALASVCDGNMQPLAEVLRDESLSVWTRIALIDAWALRVIQGDAEPGPLEDELLLIGQRNAQRLLAGQQADAGDAEIIDWVVLAAADIGSKRLAPVVREWFGQELIDPQHIDLKGFEQELDQPLEQRRAGLAKHHRGYIEDVEREIGWWAWYGEEPLPPVPQPTRQVRTTPKIGRNDPCPCGSGKKFKKCHGAST